jgi:hypothetical protein
MSRCLSPLNQACAAALSCRLSFVGSDKSGKPGWIRYARPKAAQWRATNASPPARCEQTTCVEAHEPPHQRRRPDAKTILPHPSASTSAFSIHAAS